MHYNLEFLSYPDTVTSIATLHYAATLPEILQYFSELWCYMSAVGKKNTEYLEPGNTV